MIRPQAAWERAMTVQEVLSLPRYLSAEDVERVIAFCDPDSAVGQQLRIQHLHTAPDAQEDARLLRLIRAAFTASHGDLRSVIPATRRIWRGPQRLGLFDANGRPRVHF